MVLKINTNITNIKNYKFVMKQSIFFILLYSCSQFVFAEKVSEAYSYEELEAAAYKNNVALKSLFHQWRSTLSQIAVARALPNPKLSYTEYLEEVQTRVGPQKRKVMLNQMFPWFGTLSLRGDAVSKKAVLLDQEIQLLGLSLSKELKSTIYEIILIDKKVEINRGHEKVLKELEKSLKGLVASGKTDLANVLRIQVEIEKLRDDIVTLTAMKEPLLHKIKTIVQVDLIKALPSSIETTAALPHEQVLIEKYKQFNPEWKMNQTRQDMAKVGLELAQKKNYPDLGVGFTWIETESTALMNSGEDPLMLTFDLSIPLWRNKIRSEINSSKEELKSYEYESEDILNKFKDELKMLLFKIEDAERKIELYGERLLEKSKAAYLATKKSHESGQTTFQNVLDSERILLKFMLDFEVAKVEKGKYMITLESIVGQI